MTHTYLELIQSFPPRPIHSATDFEKTQAVVNNLLDKELLTADEADYLEVLGTLIYDYEQQQEDLIPDIHGVELLRVLMEERELKQKDLVSIFKTESIVSAVLNGKRQLTTRHIQELAAFFHVSPAVFFPANFSENFLAA
ncbi:helix-turn-helix domain-containing protein [Picosynechococcus sp. PCC 8807]|uniref:helix-turn-helix domain-containing protein n=1 Tax=Picosynechococcus sp. PCC 8807 TaxID=195248 RepID=UPI000810BEA6|nr:transcriptional regulator [Picosynechococcus sp. PCC 8807]ANV92081.1 transcriptional regulator [Picosynechococcus sp. PCC 8807]